MCGIKFKSFDNKWELRAGEYRNCFAIHSIQHILLVGSVYNSIICMKDEQQKIYNFWSIIIGKHVRKYISFSIYYSGDVPCMIKLYLIFWWRNICKI